MQYNKINFRGNRSTIYEGSKRLQKRRRELTFLEQQQMRREVQLQIFKDMNKDMKFCER